MVVSEINTGVAPNLNRGIAASKGEWIKLVSGDDLLPPHSITEFMDFCSKKSCTICCCKLMLFGEDGCLVKKDAIAYNGYYRLIAKDLAFQRRLNSRRLFVPGPGLFFTKTLFDSVKGFDEAYPFAEEWPFISKILSKENRIFLVDNYLYQYRISVGSLCRDELGMNERVFKDMKKYIWQEVLVNLIRRGDILYAWHLYVTYSYLTIMYNSDKMSFAYKYAKYMSLFSPLWYINILNRIIKKLIQKESE
jgi:alpha-1,3-rhamnosyltransferase